VILTPEANEIQDTANNDLPNPSEVSFTTAAGDFTPPTLIDTQLAANVVTTDFGDIGDQFTITFGEVMSASTFGGINVQDGDGSSAFLPCGPVASCTWNAAGTMATVTLTAPVPPFIGVTPGLQLPLTITTLSGFFDLQGNAANILGSADRVIDNEIVAEPFAPPTIMDSRIVNNIATSDFGDTGDAFSATFNRAMNNTDQVGLVLLQDQDGTTAFLSCGPLVICTWNTAGTTLTVTVLAPVPPGPFGSTPGLQVPLRVAMLGAISDAAGKVPDLAGSADTLIDYE
jgi:hypothetical protein